MSFVVAVVAGIVPMVIYPFFLYWMDRYEKEPLGLLAGVFLWGFVPAAILSLISQLVLEVPLFMLDETGTMADFLGGSVFAPITEEFFKGLAVLAVFLIWRREFDGVFDGIIYGGLVGFGFAAIENVLYFLDADAATILLRAVIFGLNHAFYTSLTGIGFGIARHSPRLLVRAGAPLIGLLAAIIAHSIHNTTVSLVDPYPALLCLTIVADWGGVLFVFVVMVIAIRREREWMIVQLRDEVKSETLSPIQYEVSTSPVRRFRARLSALITGGLGHWLRMGHYFSTLTELAYRKHAHSRRGEGGASLASINELRDRAKALSAQFADIA